MIYAQIATVGNRPIHRSVELGIWYEVSRITPSRKYKYCFLAEGLFHLMENDPYLGGGSWEFINELGVKLDGAEIEQKLWRRLC